MQSRRRGAAPGLILGLAGAIAMVVATSPAVAQPAGAEANGSFSATWLPVDESVQHIEVDVNRSVRVQLSKPIVRAMASDEDRVGVRVISPVELLLTGQSPGATQVRVWAEDDAQLVFDVDVEVNLDRLRKAIESAAPRSRVVVQGVLGNVLLTGVVRDTDTADRVEHLAQLFAPGRVQNLLQVAGEHQVLLRVTVAEMNRNATRQLGINGFLAGDDFQDAFLLNNIGGINPSNIGAAAGAAATGTIPFLTGGGGIPVGQATTLSLGFPRVQMQLFLQALRENGLARILSEPTLTTVSGQPAEFLAGGEFPIPVPQGGAGGSTSITIDYREFGVRLRFLPTVLGGGRVRMTVTPEVSELDFSAAVNLTGFVVPGLSTRMASTTVEVGNGQTLVIAGLLSDQVRANSTRVPGLGEVPVLGALFRSVRFQRNLSELVIMATPEIVSPLNPDQVPPMPGEGLMDPDDWELFGLGVLEKGASPVASGLVSPSAVAPSESETSGNESLDDEGVPIASMSNGAKDANKKPEVTPMVRQPAIEPPVSTTPTGVGPTLLGPWGPSSLAEEKDSFP